MKCKKPEENRAIKLSAPGDTKSDPLVDGRFRMVPSGELVDYKERNWRLRPVKNPCLGLHFHEGGEIAKRAIANPRRVKIYSSVIKIYASKAGMPHNCDAECKRHGHRYVHKFKSGAAIYGLPDGSIMIK